MTKAPFRIEEEGWGEFEIIMHLTPIGAKSDQNISHDLNFQQGETYSSTHVVTFRNPKGDLLDMLNSSAGDYAGPSGGKKDKKRARKDKTVDIEKLGDLLQRMNEEDLLQVVQMVHDHKSADTYTKNDVDNGEFHVDLYTLPDNLVKMLWDYTVLKVGDPA
jgi:transcription initiation factor IIF auxiliary subunit